MKRFISMFTALTAVVAAVVSAGSAWAQDGAIPDPVAGWNTLWYELLIDLWVIGIVFGVAALYMLYKYRAKNPNDIGSGPKLTRAQAWGWALIPAAVFLADDFFLSAKGWSLWNIYRTVPENAMEVKVTGYQWYWEFEYENGVITEELNIPVGQPVVLRMTAVDVIHSFFVPELRVKEDVMPGRMTYIWLNPLEEASYVATCTEYCGIGHSAMPTMVNSMSREDFDAWLEKEAAQAALQRNNLKVSG